MMPPPPPPVMPLRPEPSHRPRRFPVGTLVIALLVIAASVGALFFFSGAKVKITPTANPITVSGTFAATKSQGELPFELVTVEKTATASVPAESTENVTQSAQGTIIVQNMQDAPQALIKNTRFETPEGLIFRIRDSITVPAARNGEPGTLSVTVYADEAGERYNVGPTTFTLPGLSGSDTFSKVNARSMEAMKGGFSGPRPTISEATKDAEFAKLQSTLDAELRAAIEGQVREGYVLVPGGTASQFEEQPDTAGAGNTVDLAMRGVIRGVIFPEEMLARTLAYQSVGTYSGQPLKFESLSGLMLAPAEGLIPTEGEESFSFTLTGTTTLVWKVDPAKVSAAVAGKSREQAEVALQALPEVDGALLVLKPFWVGSFPADPAKITVSVEGEEEAK
ncbi:MAG TPA: hypothetical protein VEA36_02755 [Candidatus Paceibacterota bacterium]|nr:hypothetical protein [Candidatus Paceibacterota bacterium]